MNAPRRLLSHPALWCAVLLAAPACEELRQVATTPVPPVVRPVGPWIPGSHPGRDLEPNDGLTEATTIEIGSRVEGQVGLPAGTDAEDWFRLVMPRRGQFTCWIKNTTPTDVSNQRAAAVGGPEIYSSQNSLLSRRGRRVTVGKTGPTETVMVERGQEIFVRIQRSSSNGGARYVLETSLD